MGAELDALPGWSTGPLLRPWHRLPRAFWHPSVLPAHRPGLLPPSQPRRGSRREMVMLDFHGDGWWCHVKGQPLHCRDGWQERGAGGERLRRAPGLQSPPRRGRAAAGQASAPAAETFPSSSCSSVKVTLRDAAGSVFPRPRVPADALTACQAPSACVGHAATLPRVLLPERGARFPAVSCLG